MRPHLARAPRSKTPVRPIFVPTPSGYLAGIRVLVVEHHPASAKLLAAEGCEVQTAVNADGAAPILRVFQPHVIVLELVLPCMSGLLFAQRIKSDPETQNIVIVAVTAFKGLDTEWVTRSAGCAAFVQKPIDVLTFAEIIRTHLGLEEQGSHCGRRQSPER